MLILTLAFRNLLRRTRRTVLLGGLICIGIGGLFFANAVFESTNQGLRTSFVRSLTGDLVLAAPSQTQYSLFGSEVPIISDYEIIPPIPSFSEVQDYLRDHPDVDAWTPIVAAAAAMQIDNVREPVPLFGIQPDTYFTVNPDIEIVSGNPAALTEGGVLLNATLALSVENRLGRRLRVGEPIVFTTFTNEGFRSRRGTFAGVHRYVSTTETLDRVVLADPTTVRGLIDYTLGFAEPAEAQPTEPDDFDLFDLFDDAEDIPAPGESAAPADSLLDAVEAAFAEGTERDSLVVTDTAAWSFVLLRARDGRGAALRRQIERDTRQDDMQLRVMTWRQAAGLAAQAVFSIQIAFYTGLVFVAAAAVLVIMNALVISVLERSTEIGTMRGIGAGTVFIRRLFVAESLLLTIVSALLGILIGVLVSLIVARSGITLTNDLLINLFGGTVIRPVVTASSVLFHLAVAAVIGALAWIYPVSVATRIQPASAMMEG
ncbi:MAG: FtsX-like permease family protein [Spirochaetaceae bacterium]|nr:MAG: FtsX-like permease family protein [Spirochaetaceae bacterium]